MKLINLAVATGTARWQPASSVGPLPWDRDGEWTVEKNYLMNTWFPQRTAKLLTQLRARGWYPVDAPEMSQTAGPVSPGSPVFLAGPTTATICYTLDGSDPRHQGGGVNPTALAYRSTLTNQVLSQPYDDIPGQGAVWSFTFPAGLVLVPGERIVVIKDQALFDARYRTVGSPWYHAGIRVAGVWNGSLANSGEEIIIPTAGGASPVRFSYEDSGSWPGRADGIGSSLE
jgi:hypothetical protein